MQGLDLWLLAGRLCFCVDVGDSWSFIGANTATKAIHPLTEARIVANPFVEGFDCIGIIPTTAIARTIRLALHKWYGIMETLTLEIEQQVDVPDKLSGTSLE